MKKRITNRQTPLSFTVDLVTDTARLLQRVGVVQIDEMALDKAIHGLVEAQYLVTHAAELFMNRKQQGLITLEQLLGTLRSEAA